MVREGFGTSGNDIRIGVDILTRAALSPAFAHATDRYWDNDARAFGRPAPDAADLTKAPRVVDAVDAVLERLGAERSR